MVCQVLRELDGRRNLLLFHELSTVQDDAVRPEAMATRLGGRFLGSTCRHWQ
jgi:hypothetical protein